MINITAAERWQGGKPALGRSLELVAQYIDTRDSVMKKAIGSLDLNRPQSRQETLGGVRLQNTELVKEKLLEELVELEKQMEALKSQEKTVDFSMMQTYKEMIHSRKTFFNELNR